jgi:hypothetical protein
MGRPIPPERYPDRYPITPRRLSKKAVIAGVVCTVLLAVLCLSGLTLSMSGTGGAKPVGASSAHPTQPPAGQPGKPTQPAAVPKTATTTAGQIVTMPDIVGVNAAVAEDQLHRLGLRNLEFTSGDKRYLLVLVLRNWTVTKQSVAAGTRVDKTAPIVLTCVKP